MRKLKPSNGRFFLELEKNRFQYLDVNLAWIRMSIENLQYKFLF